MQVVPSHQDGLLIASLRCNGAAFLRLDARRFGLDGIRVDRLFHVLDVSSDNQLSAVDRRLLVVWSAIEPSSDGAGGRQISCGVRQPTETGATAAVIQGVPRASRCS